MSTLKVENIQHPNAASVTLTLDTSGRIGIGTSTPGRTLTIQNSSTIVTAALVSNPANIAYLLFGDTDSDAQGRVQYDNSADALQLYSAGSERLRIDSSGRLGIGTSSPSVLTHLYGAANEMLRLEASSVSYDAAIRIYNAGTAIANVQAGPGVTGAGLSVEAYGSRNITFLTNTTERARIDSSGRLLVGTSSAFSAGASAQYGKLQVVANSFSASTQGIVAIGRGQAAGASIASGAAIGTLVFTDNTGGEFAQIACEADAATGTNDYPGRLVFSTTADGASSLTERMRIGNNGDISYNSATIAHGAQFAATKGSNGYVFGPNASNAFVVYNTAGTGVYLVSGNTGWSANSDERLKTNLEPIKDGLNKVGALRAVTGRYKTDDETVSRSFLIAQDVQQVLPEAVDVQEDGDKTLGLRYTEVIPLLVAALKESKERIETLEAKVAALETA